MGTEAQDSALDTEFLDKISGFIGPRPAGFWSTLDIELFVTEMECGVGGRGEGSDILDKLWDLDCGYDLTGDRKF